MAIVPRDPDLLALMMGQAQRMQSMEAGCGGGEAVDPTLPVGDLGSDPGGGKSNMERDIIIANVASRRQSGTLIFPGGGKYPPIGPAKLQGFGVTAAGVADRVGISARLHTTAKGKGVSGGTMFALPPGWWPLADLSFNCPTSDGAHTLQVTVSKGQGLVELVVPGGAPAWLANVTWVDLSGIAFDATGGACPGDAKRPTDPTWAGDGRQWDTCPGGGVGDDTAADPSVPPGGGGGLTWSDVPVRKDIAITTTFSKWQWAIGGGIVYMRGDITITSVFGSGSLVVKPADFPAAFSPAASRFTFAHTGDTSYASILVGISNSGGGGTTGIDLSAEFGANVNGKRIQFDGTHYPL